MRSRTDILTRSERVFRSLRRVGYAWLWVAALGAAMVSAQTTIDLDAGEEDLRILGEDGIGYLGFSVAGGDVNGDGLDDLILGAYGASPLLRTGAGITYIIFGDSTNSLPTPLDVANGPSGGVGMVVLGGADFDQAGRSVAAGDVNGDGIDDIIIGVPGATAGALSDAGIVHVIYGSAISLPDTLDLATQSTDLTLLGESFSNSFGGAVAAGDINGDGLDDVIAGARKADGPGLRTDVGKTYVVYGDSTVTVPDTLDMASALDKNIEIMGALKSDNLGNAVASGNINGDAADDVVVAAFWADPNGSLSGEVYVIYGDPADTTGGFTAIDLATPPALGEGVHIKGSVAFNRTGQSVAAGDLNGDGFDDIAIGANGADPAGMSAAGEVYILYGGSLASSLDLPGAANVTISGEAPLSSLGWSMVAMNLNGDGFDDLLVGAITADAPGGISVGNSHVMLGDPQLPSQLRADGGIRDAFHGAAVGRMV